ncbi:MAG: NAD(P)H-hydrate dehydratase [Tannerellaceae bacterium]|jgi:NAD(P)H-hydrate epimerase|nr:NAD(P)H-hydrate dehydratase [Tannerellaceae bacterium]
MIKIFTAGQIKELDQYTIENEPVLPEDLVGRAAGAFACEFARRYGKQYRVVVFAGQGNNGADALAVAALLTENYSFPHVETYLFNPPSGKLSEVCERNRQRLKATGSAAFTEVKAHFSPPPLGERDVVIDGLFGSGLNRPLTGGFAGVVGYINRSGATIVSIDLPSGLFCEDNRENSPAAVIRAKLTLTFGSPRLAFFLPENAMYAGEWKTLDIGIHPRIIADTHTPYYMVDEDYVAQSIRPRSKFVHKGMFGHALLVAGSRGKMGAALLAAKACLRAGAGLLTVHLPSCGEAILQSAFPEAMLSLDEDTGCVTSLPDDLEPYTAIGIGPGLGRSAEAAYVLKTLLAEAASPLVIDADAINIIAANKEDMLPLIPPDTILTPHVKEFERLAGECDSSYERLMKARTFAAEHKLVVVLKGACTATCTPQGNIFFNNTGNPGMATAGSGDVLTGLILGLLASGHPPVEAATCGVLLHGLAGDIALAYQSEESLTAGDIIEKIGKAFRQTRMED